MTRLFVSLSIFELYLKKKKKKNHYNNSLFKYFFLLFCGMKEIKYSLLNYYKVAA